MTETLNGARVLVTGADGFIGSHLVEQLVDAGAHVRAMVYYNSWNQLGWLSDIPSDQFKHIEVFAGDVRDQKRMVDAVAGCQYIFHLASLIAIPYSYRAIESYIQTNVSGTANVLMAAKESPDLIRVLHTSTSETYGTAQFVPITESHPLVGQSPYAASKIGADKIAESIQLSFGVPVVTARPFNTYGPRQTARAVIPTIASQLLSGCTELTLGALTPTRDFNFARDTAAAMISLAMCADAVGEVVNIGTGEEWSIEETAHLLMKITGRDVPIKCSEDRLRPEKSEVNRLLASNEKIQKLTGWRPRHSFHQGLEETAAWIGKNLNYFNAAQFAI